MTPLLCDDPACADALSPARSACAMCGGLRCDDHLFVSATVVLPRCDRCFPSGSAPADGERTDPVEVSGGDRSVVDVEQGAPVSGAVGPPRL